MFTPKRWGLLVLIGLTFPTYSFAQEISLNTAIQHALTQHPSVHAAYEQKEVLQKQLNHAQVGPNPELELGIGRKNDGSTSGLTVETTAKQTFLYPGKLESQKAVVLSEISVQDLEIRKLKASLASTIFIKAAQWQASQQKIEANQKRIHKLNWITSYLGSRPFISPQKQLEYRLIESDIKEHQLDTVQLAAQSEAYQRELKTLISEPFSESLGQSEFQKIQEQRSTSEILESKNPEIQLLKLRLAQIDLETQKLQQEANPNFDVFGRYASESATGTDQFLSIGVGFELPVSNKNRFSIQAQENKKNVLTFQLEQLIREKQVQWQAALRLNQQARAVLDLYNTAWVTKLETSVDQSIEGFKKGQTDLLSVLALESQWVTVMNKRADAQLDLLTAKSTFAELLGQSPITGETL